MEGTAATDRGGARGPYFRIIQAVPIYYRVLFIQSSYIIIPIPVGNFFHFWQQFPVGIRFVQSAQRGSRNFVQNDD